MDTILEIGLPYWNMLEPDEKLSLIAHELGHLVNRDPLKQRLPQMALNILFRLGHTICPKQVFQKYYGQLFLDTRNIVNIAELLMVPINYVLIGIALIFWSMAHLLLKMMWLESQRAEYRADLYALKITSLNACLNDLEKMNCGDLVWDCAKKRVLNKNKQAPESLFGEAYQKWLHLPLTEKERLRRILKKQQSRVDATHPTTFLRMEMLRHQSQSIKQTAHIEYDWSALAKELEVHNHNVALRLMDEVRDSLYARSEKSIWVV